MSKSKQKRKQISQPVIAKRAGLLSRWIVLATLIILALAGFAGRRLFLLDSQKRSLLSELSKLNLSGIESQVATKIQKLREDVKNNPRSASAWGKLAMNLDVHDLKNESIPVYQEAALLDPSDFRWPYFTGILFAQMGMQQAIESFERANRIDPDYVPLLLKYGDALVQFDKTDQAIEKYGQALNYDPKSASANFGLARIEFAKGSMEASREFLNKALERNPAYGESYNLLVSVCKRLKDEECVLQASEGARRFTGKTDLVDPVYAELIAEGESSIWYRFRGSDYFKRGLYAEAIAEFQTALRLRPDAQSHEDLAKAFSGAGKFPESAEHYNAAIATHPTANNYFGLGLTLAKMGQFTEAEKWFRKAIERNSNFAEAYFNLAVLYAKSGHLKETLVNLKHAIRINPEYKEAHYHLVQTYLATNNYAAASQEYKILSRLDPDLAKRLQMLIDDVEKKP